MKQVNFGILTLLVALFSLQESMLAQGTVNDMTFTTKRKNGSGRTWQTDDVRLEFEKASNTLIVIGYYHTGDSGSADPTQELTLKFRDFSGDGDYNFNGGNAEWEDRNSGTGICKYLSGGGGSISTEIDSVSVPGSYAQVFEGSFEFRCESAPRVGDPFTTDITGTFTVEIGYDVTAPAEEEVLTPGNEVDIEWSSFTPGNVDIYYTLEDPSTDPERYEIKKGVDASLGKFTWEVADTMSPKAWIVLVNPNFETRSFAGKVFKIRGPHLAKIAYDASGSCPECPYYVTYSPAVHGWSVENGDPSTFKPSGRSDSWRFDYGSATDPFTEKSYPSFFTRQPISAKRDRYPEWPNFVDAFGEEVFYGSGNSQGVMIDASARVWSYHADPYLGSCYALAVISSMAFIDPEMTLSNYPEIGSLSQAKSLFSADIGNGLADGISYTFAYQSGTFEVNRRVNGTSRGPNFILDELREYLSSDSQSELMAGSNTLCIASDRGYPEGGAHAVTAYRIEEDDENAKIYVYDNNYPGDEDKYVSVDKKRNTWSYAPFNWGGVDDIWLAMPFSKFDEIPILYYYDPGESNVAMIRPGMGLKGRSLDGARFTYSDEDGFLSSDPEAVPLYPLNGIGRPGSFTFPSDYNSLEFVAGGEEGVSTLLIGHGLTMNLWNGAAEGEVTEVTWNTNGITIINPESGPQLTNFDALFEKDGLGYTLGIRELSLGGGDSLRIDLSDEDETIAVTNYGAMTRYEIMVRQTGREGLLQGGYSPVTIESGKRHRIVPVWSDLAEDLAVYTTDDQGSNDSIVLDNLLMSVTKNLRQALSTISMENPVRDASSLSLFLQNTALVKVEITSLLGESRGNLFEGHLEHGEHSVPIALEGLDAGTYLVSLVIDGDVIKTLVVVKAE